MNDLFSDYKENKITEKEFIRKLQSKLTRLLSEDKIDEISTFLMKIEGELLNGQIIISAVKRDDEDEAVKLTTILLKVYCKKSRFYKEAITAAIRYRRFNIAKLLVSKLPSESHHQLLSYIISQSIELSPENEEHALNLFLECLAIDTSLEINSKLYHQALREKALVFIKYYADNFPEKVKSDVEAFQHFCVEETSSNEMVQSLIKAGAKLESLKTESWVGILKQRHLSRGENATEAHNILYCIPIKEIQSYITNDVALSFLNEIKELFKEPSNKDKNEINTLVWLLQKGLIDATTVFNFLVETYNDKANSDDEKLGFLWGLFRDSKHSKTAALCCVLAYRLGFLEEFADRCSASRKDVAIMLHSFRGVSDIDPLMLLMLLPDYSDKIMEVLI